MEEQDPAKWPMLGLLQVGCDGIEIKGKLKFQIRIDQGFVAGQRTLWISAIEGKRFTAFAVELRDALTLTTHVPRVTTMPFAEYRNGWDLAIAHTIAQRVHVKFVKEGDEVKAKVRIFAHADFPASGYEGEVALSSKTVSEHFTMPAVAVAG